MTKMLEIIRYKKKNITISEHKKWFLESIQNDNKIMLIFSIDSIPIVR